MFKLYYITIKFDCDSTERIMGQYIKLITGNVRGIDGELVHLSKLNHISNPEWEK